MTKISFCGHRRFPKMVKLSLYSYFLFFSNFSNLILWKCQQLFSRQCFKEVEKLVRLFFGSSSSFFLVRGAEKQCQRARKDEKKKMAEQIDINSMKKDWIYYWADPSTEPPRRRKQFTTLVGRARADRAEAYSSRMSKKTKTIVRHLNKPSSSRMSSATKTIAW